MLPVHFNSGAGRRFRKILIGCMVAIAATVLSCARFQAAAPKAGSPFAPSDWPHAHSDLPPDPALVFGRLDNGFRYVLLANPEPADRVSMHLDVQAGSLNETESQRGLAHYLEHMQFNGSEHFPPGELVKYFQRIGMQFGPDANARTGFTSTVYDILLPEGSEKSLGEGMRVLKDYAAGALLLEAEVARERGVILAEKRSRDSASYRTFEATLNFEMDGALPPRRLPIGTEQVIRDMTRDNLKAFYDTWYRPDNMVLVVVGDFTVDTAKTLAEEVFSDLRVRSESRPRVDFGRFHHRGTRALYHWEEEAGSTSVSIETLVQADPESDSAAHQRKRLIRDVADRIVQNRLNALLRKPDAPFTDARIGSGRFLQRVAYAEISAECSPEKWKETLRSIEQTLRQALEYGFTDAELARVKADFMSELDDAVKKASTRTSQRLASSLIAHLNSDRVFRSPAQEKAFFGPVLTGLTLDRVNQAFRTTWAADHRLVLVTGNARPAPMPAEAEARVQSVYTASRKAAVAPPDRIESVDFPYLSSPKKAGEVVFQNRIGDLDILQAAFANGNRVNLKRTDFKAGEVRFRLVFGHGRASQPPDAPGLADLTRDLVNESGLGRMDRNQLERALAGKMTRLRFDVEEDRFSFVGRSTPEELQLVFQLLYAHLRDPGFSDTAFSLVMDRFGQRYESMARTVRGAMRLQGSRFLAGGDNRFGLPPFAQFRQLTLADVTNWLAPVLDHAPLELSMVGDFDPQEALTLAARYLGGLPSRNRAASVASSRPVAFPRAETLRLPVPSRIPKGMVVVAYPTDDVWKIGKTRRLSVLSEIVSDRLREDIREGLGAAYSPYAFNRPSRAFPGYGLFRVVVQVSPEEAPLVEQRIRKISADILEGGISRDELDRALDPTLTGIKDLKRTNGYWLDTVLAGSGAHPEQITWARTIYDDYASIGIDDLLPLARTYLRRERAATIVVFPAFGASSKEAPKEGTP